MIYSRVLTSVFSLTLLISAALIFSVQPMFSKMILPLLGGTPQVWTTAMLFFQIMLLAGYFYAHISDQVFGLRTQIILHLSLIFIFLTVLPFSIPEGWTPGADQNPTLWQLLTMTSVLGGPFFILAGSAPLFQKWFSQSDHKDADSPYFLYGASNLGSMGALLAYPFLIEPHLHLPEQSQHWMVGYIILAACVIACGSLVWKNRNIKTGMRASHKHPEHPGNLSTITWKRRSLWLLLSFLPSSLMLGVTSYITTDIASVPLLWIIPLALYVGTFILVFAKTELISKKIIFIIQGLLMAALIALMLAYGRDNIFIFIGLHFTLFFFCALACHKELADSKPPAAHLTDFYLMMSIGGALGGVFNAIIAPYIFLFPIEYSLVLCAIAYMRYYNQQGHRPRSIKNILQTFTSSVQTAWADRSLTPVLNPYLIIAAILTGIIFYKFLIALPVNNLLITVFIFVLAAALVLTRFYLWFILTLTLLLNPLGYFWSNSDKEKLVHLDRNFFGVIRVVDGDKTTSLIHGTTVHGLQAKRIDGADNQKPIPLSYYSPASPLADIFSILDAQKGQQNIAAVGLGVGSVACYSKENRHFDFFEIDPDIAGVAQNTDYFTYLSDCGSPYTIHIGDGRIQIAKQPDQSYDFILIDAFSSDNIPVHLLTTEAIQTYMKKLKPNGLLAFHISNNYLDIEPVLTANGTALGLHHMAKIAPATTIGDEKLPAYLAHYFAYIQNGHQKRALKKQGWTPGIGRPGISPWGDHYSNILNILGTGTVEHRYKLQRNRSQEK